jgi:hypothetical protein
MFRHLFFVLYRGIDLATLVVAVLVLRRGTSIVCVDKESPQMCWRWHALLCCVVAVALLQWLLRGKIPNRSHQILQQQRQRPKDEAQHL